MDNKTLIDKISDQTGLQRDDIQLMLNDFYSELSDRCIDMDSLIVPAFGQFEPKKRRERVAVHPSTGRRLLVPPKLVVNFKPSAILKGKVQ